MRAYDLKYKDECKAGLVMDIVNRYESIGRILKDYEKLVISLYDNLVDLKRQTELKAYHKRIIALRKEFNRISNELFHKN